MSGSHHSNKDDAIRKAAARMSRKEESPTNEATAAECADRLLSSRAIHSCQTTEQPRSLAEENEFLKAELLATRLELARYKEQQYVATNSVPCIKIPQPIPKISEFALNTPLKRRVIASSPSSHGNPPIRKINKHPSEASLGALDYKDQVSVESDTSIEKHESGRGLKHRKHSSPVLRQQRHHSPLMLHYNAHRVSVQTPNGSNGIHSTTNDSDSGHSYDVETTSFLKEDRAMAMATPPTPETAATVISSETSMLEESYETAAAPSFFVAIQDRAGWLVGLLVLQSMSSFIISRNEKLLQKHLVIVRFLTMLVGAGGNAGNQASVGVIRGLAMGSVNDRNIRETLLRELQMGLGLSFVLGVAGAVRAAVFMTPFMETLAITTCLVAIVFISVLLGAVLPLIMKYFRIDPAHSSTTIQVIMDILGVLITVRKYSFHTRSIVIENLS